MAEKKMSLVERLQKKQARIGIIGLGYVGLPLVMLFLKKGFSVLGFDVDERKVSLLNQGKSYIKHIKEEELNVFIKNRSFLATEDFKALGDVDVIIICVPTPLDSHKNPDLSFVISTVETISEHLKEGHLVILESTSYPGTTEEKILPLFEKGGMKAGKHFYLAYSPEREDPGNRQFPTERIPKLVGGTTQQCLETARTLYDQVVEKTVPVSSTRVAEAAKLLENIFRSVNIALVNEMKMIFDRMGIDVWEVIEAAATKPFGFVPFFPGPGYGGHCIPVDPYYMAWKAKEVGYITKFIELAGEINTFMPHYVVSKSVDALNRKGKSMKGARILVLGLAYKKDIDDQRESPALKIIHLLQKKGARVSYNDPHVPQASGYRDYPGLKMQSVPLDQKKLKEADAVIIATDHSDYDYGWIVDHSSLVIDTRNAVKEKRKNVIRA
jgi:UDP-N-acetyl-D-glucosamine dehydrogenase